MRSESQASGWCCMHSIFFQILSIFSSPAGYSYCFEFQVHILCIGMAPYWPTLQFYVCVYILFASTWRPQLSVITTLYYVRLFFIVKCGIMCFLCAMHVFNVRASSSSPRLPLCQISFLLRPPLLS